MLSARFCTFRRVAAGFLLALAVPVVAAAQGTTYTVTNQATLAAALGSAVDGDAIVFANNITLTAELPSVSVSLTIDGNNFTLSGNNQFRGLVVGAYSGGSAIAVSATIQNITIANTVATGGAGGTGAAGGGGGAGMGGALFVAASATVTVSNVNLVSNSAVGGAGGIANGVATAGGGGGGMGGAGGTGNVGGGGGGGLGVTATGGAEDTAGAQGILAPDPGGYTSAAVGGNNAGGGAGGSSSSVEPGAGGGSGGSAPSGSNGGAGGFGGGGGGASVSLCLSGGCVGGSGDYGGGGGGGASVSSQGGYGGFGAGGGGSTDGSTTANGGYAGGTGSATGNGGGGAGLGGAVFVQGSGNLIVGGAFTINGNSVAAGPAGAGATAGGAFGSGIYVDGFSTLNVSSNENVTIAGGIADGVGSGFIDAGSLALSKSGTGTLTLSGNNTYVGGTSINGGTVSISSNANLGGGSVSIYGGATLAITSSGTYNHGTGLDGNAILKVSPGQTANWVGSVYDAQYGGALNLTGGGTLILGNATNSYSLGTVVTGGSTLSVAADGALGLAGTGLTLGDATTAGTLALTTGGLFTTTRNLTLGAGGGTVDTSAGTDAVWLGNVSGAGGLTKNGAGTLELFGVNSYSGATTVNAGTLVGGFTGAFGSAPVLQIGSLGTIDFGGYSEVINSLSGTGQLVLSGGAGMTIGVTNLDSTFAGNISGSGGILKGGSGTLTLSGNNSFGGGIFVLGGTVAASADANLGGAGPIGLSDTTLALTSTNSFAHDLILYGAPTVNVSPGATATWNGAVLDGSPGSLLHVGGGGTLALYNFTNNYSGGTFVNGGSTVLVSYDAALGAPGAGIQLGDASSAGTLAFSSPSLLSARPITLGSAGGAINTIGSTNVTLDGGISGSGGLTKTGAGTLTLAGSNTYAGTTTVAGGTLRAGATNVFGASGNLFINSGSSVDLAGFSQNLGSLNGGGGLALNGASIGLGGNNSSSVFSGALSGNGGLTKNGSGILTLTGANSYTGGTTINGGTVLGNTTSLQGNFFNKGTLAFDQASDGTYNGIVSGSGLLVKTGAAALTLGGANTYTGGTLISDGTLIGSTSSLQGTIENDSALVFDQATDGVFNGIVFGSGTITKTGAGGLTFLEGSPVGGRMLVNQGVLSFSGVFSGDMNIGAGAGLRGAGVITGSLNLGGSIFVPAPGTAAGSVNARRLGITAAADTIAVPTLYIGGDLNATPGSTLNFTVTPNGAPPIVVNGTATLTNTHVVVGSTLLNLPRYSTYLGMTAGSIVNNGVDASSTLPGIVPALTFDNQTMYVTMLNENIPLQVVAPGTNSGPVGAALDRVKKGATGDLAFVIKELTALNDAQLADALHQLSGELHATKVQQSVTDATIASDIVRDEVSGADELDIDGKRPTGRQSLRPWFEFMGDHANYTPSDTDHAVANVGGGAGGLDFRPIPKVMFGAGGSFSQGVMSMVGLGGSSNMSAPRAFGYGGFNWGPFGFHGGASSASNSYHTTRPIAFQATVPALAGTSTTASVNGLADTAPVPAGQVPLSGGVDRTAQANQGGVSRDQWSEWQDTLRLKGWVAESKIGWRRATYHRDAFDETGAQAISLSGPAQDLTTKEANVNIHVYRRAGRWRPNVLIDYKRELGDENTSTSVQFQGQPNSVFQTDGIPVAQTQFHMIAGVTMVTGFFGMQYTLQYETLQAPNESHQGVHFSVRFR